MTAQTCQACGRSMIASPYQVCPLCLIRLSLEDQRALRWTSLQTPKDLAKADAILTSLTHSHTDDKL